MVFRNGKKVCLAVDLLVALLRDVCLLLGLVVRSFHVRARRAIYDGQRTDTVHTY